MIELNLLPKHLRKKKTKQIEIPELPYLPIAAGVLGVFIFVHLILVVMIAGNSRLSSHLEKKWEGMAPQKAKTEKIAREINALEKRVMAVRQIVKPDLDWARLLAGLNDSIIPNVWLSEFRITPQAGNGGKGIPASLNITGYAVGRSEVGMSVVGKFMESLKKNQNFFMYFDEIELQHIKNAVIAGEDVMMFKLICNFKGAKKEKAPEAPAKRKRRRRR